MTTRRGLILGTGAAIVFVATWQRVFLRPPDLAFEPLDDAPGWEFATAGEVSGLGTEDLLTLGLGTGPEPLPPGRLTEVVHRGAAGEPAALAVFSDFFCPFCRALVSRLAQRAAAGAPVTWHELPLLGPASELAARALVAADLQEGYAAFHEALLREGFRPAPAWMGAVARQAGLDAARLQAEMDGPRVAARLAESAAAAARLGFYATPGLVVGQRAILGSITDAQIDALLERA